MSYPFSCRYPILTCKCPTCFHVDILSSPVNILPIHVDILSSPVNILPVDADILPAHVHILSSPVNILPSPVDISSHPEVSYFGHSARAFGGEQTVSGSDVPVDEAILLEVGASFGHIDGAQQQVLH